ncbi:MAG: 2-oxo acid dehydrogenase subunit E2 [Myxococcota bacterium]
MLRDAARGLTTGQRVDGTLIPNLHPYRRLMAHIMPTRNESVVYFDTFARTAKLMQYLADVNQRFHVDITHCLVAAGAIGLAENPKMNRFVAGRRLYERNGRYVTFSMKRQKLGREAKLSAVKLEMPAGETFRSLCDRMNAHVEVERSDTKTAADKEFDLFNRLPRSVLDVAVSAFKQLDHWNLLPRDFIQGDGMYTSMFIANLGSLGMSAGYHHLYEWGNCPLFMMVGQIEKRPLVVGDHVVPTDVMPIRYSYDERIDDGLNARFGIDAVNKALENPYEYFGCLKDDGSDARPLDAGAPKR